MTYATSLAFQASGPKDASPIIFLHGGGVGSWMWSPVMERLPDFYCLAPDQPEHGGSRRIAPFSMALAAEKVSELILSQTPRGKSIVVGLSEGAQVTVQLLATSPETVEKAFISSALLRPLPGMGMMGSPAILRWAYRLMLAPFKRWDAWIRLNMKYSAGIPAEYYPQFKTDFQSMTEAEFVNLLLANQRFRLPPGLEKVAVPVLVVAGRHEHPAMQQSARDLVAALPNATGAWLNLGSAATLAQEHNWALTNSDLFAQTLRAWLEGAAWPRELELFPGGINLRSSG